MRVLSVRGVAAAGCAVVLLLGGGPAAQPGWAGERPDFTGVWRHHGGPPLGGGIAAMWPEDPPLTELGRERVEAYQRLVDGTGATPGEFCVGTGMPGSMLGSGPYPMEIIQRPEQITIIYEAHTEIRRVFVDQPPMDPADLVPSRNGYSVGRWEDDELVIETTSLSESVDQRAAHSEQAHILERYRLDESEDGRRVIRAQLTLTDPKFYTRQVTVEKNWVEAGPDVHMMLYECNEPDWEDFLEQRRQELAQRDGDTE